MTDRVWIGVDLGLEGAIVFLRGDQLGVVDMPVVTYNRRGSLRRALDFRGIVDAFTRFDTLPVGAFATFEAVHGMPKAMTGTKGSFSLGTSSGAFHMLFASLEIPYRTVTPRAWKKHYGIEGTDKNASRLEAGRRFPTLDLSLKKHHGRAEAALLASFGRHLETRGELGEVETP